MKQPKLHHPRGPVVAARHIPDGHLPIPWTGSCKRASRSPQDGEAYV